MGKNNQILDDALDSAERVQERQFKPDVAEITALSEYMRVFFRKTFSESYKKEHLQYVINHSQKWTLNALLQAFHYLLIWSLEYRCPATVMESIEHQDWCWYGRLQMAYRNHTIITISSPTGNRFEYAIPNSDSGFVDDRLTVFNGEEFYAECLIALAVKIGIKSFSSTRLWFNNHLWVIATLRRLGLECPFITTTIL